MGKGDPRLRPGYRAAEPPMENLGSRLSRSASSLAVVGTLIAVGGMAISAHPWIVGVGMLLVVGAVVKGIADG